MSACRSCGAAIRWVRSSANGRMMPLDVAPLDRGSVATFGPGVITIDPMGMAYVLKKTDARTPEATYYRSHFATCPNAKEHRR